MRAAANSPVLSESRLTRLVLTIAALAVLGFLVVLPLAIVFTEALRQGVQVFVASITSEDARAALRLSLLVVAIVVPLNAAFGIAAAWLLARFQFRGRGVLVSLIDLPFAISPVVVGLVFVILFGRSGWAGPWLIEHDIRVLFALPAIVIATAFITVPFVARELLPLMQQQGSDEELAARTLGASGMQMFWRVTLPNIKWALIYAVLLTAARALGEFGAVSVVSGHIRGETNTLPLHVEILYNEYNFAASFAVASLLAVFALVTLAVKSVLEWRFARELRHRG